MPDRVSLVKTQLWGAVIAVAAMAIAGSGVAAEKRQPVAATRSVNPANDELLRLSPSDQAAKLAHAVSQWCIGTEAFPMGVTASGKAKGYAYWSLRCADGSTWAVQVDPRAGVTAMDCENFKADAPGKECFKKF